MVKLGRFSLFEDDSKPQKQTERWSKKTNEKRSKTMKDNKNAKKEYLQFPKGQYDLKDRLGLDDYLDYLIENTQNGLIETRRASAINHMIRLKMEANGWIKKATTVFKDGKAPTEAQVFAKYMKLFPPTLQNAIQAWMDERIKILTRIEN